MGCWFGWRWGIHKGVVQKGLAGLGHGDGGWLRPKAHHPQWVFSQAFKSLAILWLSDPKTPSQTLTMQTPFQTRKGSIIQQHRKKETHEPLILSPVRLPVSPSGHDSQSADYSEVGDLIGSAATSTGASLFGDSWAILLLRFVELPMTWPRSVSSIHGVATLKKRIEDRL
jgi:endonuclease/exonuclease/phosphatase (EEP) superfamily protein YafD